MQSLGTNCAGSAEISSDLPFPSRPSLSRPSLHWKESQGGGMSWRGRAGRGRAFNHKLDEHPRTCYGRLPPSLCLVSEGINVLLSLITPQPGVRPSPKLQCRLLHCKTELCGMPSSKVLHCCHPWFSLVPV